MTLTPEEHTRTTGEVKIAGILLMVIGGGGVLAYLYGWLGVSIAVLLFGALLIILAALNKHDDEEEHPPSSKVCSMEGDVQTNVAERPDYPEWAADLKSAMQWGLNDERREDGNKWWGDQFADAAAKTHDWDTALHRVKAAILRDVLPVAGDATPVVQKAIDLHDALTPRWFNDWERVESLAADWEADHMVNWEADWAARAARASGGSANSSTLLAAQAAALAIESYGKVCAAILEALPTPTDQASA